MVMEERYLAFKGMHAYTERAVGVVALVIAAFFREYAFLLWYFLAFYFILVVFYLRLYKRPSIELKDGFIQFYRSGYLVYKVKIDAIESIKLETVRLIDKRVSIWLKNGEVHDVALSIQSLFKGKDIKRILGEIV